jgi:hypothetical protein
MKRGLCILSESGRDEMFYERIAERVLDESFMAIELPVMVKTQRNAPWKEVLNLAQKTIKRLQGWDGQQHMALIIAVDNDRAPGHPGAKPPARTLPPQDRKKAARYSALKQLLETQLGIDRAAWPIDIALAVPVEMIESWVLLLLDPNRGDLPIFAEADQASAMTYYNGHPPKQLKDLCQEQAKSAGESRDQLFDRAAEQDLSVAEAASPSLKMFIDDLRAWR